MVQSTLLFIPLHMENSNLRRSLATLIMGQVASRELGLKSCMRRFQKFSPNCNVPEDVQGRLNVAMEHSGVDLLPLSTRT